MTWFRRKPAPPPPVVEDHYRTASERETARKYILAVKRSRPSATLLAACDQALADIEASERRAAADELTRLTDEMGLYE